MKKNIKANKITQHNAYELDKLYIRYINKSCLYICLSIPIILACWPLGFYLNYMFSNAINEIFTQAEQILASAKFASNELNTLQKQYLENNSNNDISAYKKRRMNNKIIYRVLKTSHKLTKLGLNL